MTINIITKKIKLDINDLNPNTSNLLLTLNRIPIFFIEINNIKMLNYLSTIELVDETFEDVITKALKPNYIYLNLVDDQKFEKVCLLEIINEDHKILYGKIKDNGNSSSFFEQDEYIESFKFNNSISNKKLIDLFLRKYAKLTDRQFMALAYQLILKRPIDWGSKESLLNNKDPYPNLFWRTRILYDLIYSEEYKNIKNSIYDILNILIDSS